jgi:hypothetical protein
MIESQNIKIVRLQSGEDIIANYTYSEDGVLLDNPMHLVFKRTPRGSVMMLLPWLPVELIKDNMAFISPNDVLSVLEPKEALIEYYGNTINHEQMEMMKNDKRLIDNLKHAYDNHVEEEIIDLSGEETEGYSEEDIKELISQKKKGIIH